jgi:hypothetical protein
MAFISTCQSRNSQASIFGKEAACDLSGLFQYSMEYSASRGVFLLLIGMARLSTMASMYDYVSSV